MNDFQIAEIAKLAGCIVVGSETAIDEDGEKRTIIRFLNPLKHKYANLTIYADGFIYISEFMDV